MLESSVVNFPVMSLRDPELPTKAKETVFVTHIVSPELFYVQKAKVAVLLDRMASKISKYAEDETLVLERDPVLGEFLVRNKTTKC